LKEYGGIESLHKHMDEERPELEKTGWVFVDIDKMLAEKEKTEKPASQ
jgi:hypothetical protein